MRMKPYDDLQVAGFYGPIRMVDPALGIPTRVPFVPHTTHPANQVVAAVHRFGRKMPKPINNIERDFFAFSKNFILLTWSEEFVLRNEDVPSVVAWLRDSTYPGSRKEQLLRLAKKLDVLIRDYSDVKSFVKWECYDKPKNARAINSPSDESKTILGPLFKAIDKATFKARFFVKGTNPRDWPKRILDDLGLDEVTETDFTSFESHHRGVFSEVIYYWMLHMIRNLDGIGPMKTLLSKLVLGRNNILFKHCRVLTDRRLMSGALWTSSANGVLNLMIMAYLASKAQCDGNPEERAAWAHENFKGFVEGDDGLCADYKIRQGDIDDLGIVLEMSPHKNFTEANFCGIVCDAEALLVIKDPISAIGKLFLLPPKYMHASPARQKSLLRARALSYLCNFSSTPVLAAVCHWILRRTKDHNLGGCLAVLDAWHAQYAVIAEKELRESKYARSEILMSTRLICEDRFGIPVHDQLRLESIIDSCNVDVMQIDLLAYTPDVMLQHALDFLYVPGSVPMMPNCDIPDVVARILDAGLEPREKCKRVRAIDNIYKRSCDLNLDNVLSTYEFGNDDPG